MTCRLCGENLPLCESHIIPAFAFRWLKETGGPIRDSRQPNRRVQDGLKPKLLCLKCERVFNKWETMFANQLFYPVVNESPINDHANEWLLKFCCSISWRALVFLFESAPLSSLDEGRLKLMHKAERRLRNYLLGRRQSVQPFDQHLLVFGKVRNEFGPETPRNVNRYFRRTIDMDFPQTDDFAATFVKIGPWQIWGHIECRGQTWMGTRVSASPSRLLRKRRVLPRHILPFLFERARKCDEALESMTETQKAKADKTLLKNLDEFSSSQLWDIIQDDIELFGLGAASRR